MSKQQLINIAIEIYEQVGLEGIIERMDKRCLFIAWRYIEDDECRGADYFSKVVLRKVFVQNVAGFGLYNFFTGFSVTELKEVCIACEMSVRSCSKEKIVDMLMDLNLKKKKTWTKPEIRRGVSKGSLERFYLRDELEKYCMERGISVQGTKKRLCTRIISQLNEELV